MEPLRFSINFLIMPSGYGYDQKCLCPFQGDENNYYFPAVKRGIQYLVVIDHEKV